MRWRVALFLLGSFFLTMSATSAWLIISGPSTFARIHAVMHLAIFGLTGTVMTVTAVRSSSEGARHVMLTFLSGVFGRRNLREVAMWAAVIAAAVSIMVAIHGAHR